MLVPLRFCLLLAAAATASVAFAQSSTASLRGVVTDPTGAVVPGATVTLTDVERNLEYSTRTDEAGRYTLTRLLPSTYDLAVEAPGFEKYVYSGFDLKVAQQATIDMELTVGMPTTTVEVTGAPPLLDMTSAELGQAVENTYVLSIPLINREFMRLVFLAPGVTPVDNDPGLGNMSNPTRFVSNGVRAGTSDVFIDGGLVSSVEQNNAGGKFLEMKPNVEAIQEFKVQTNFFSAEYGNTGGTVVNLVSKSGANEFHGSLYEFHRRGELTANSFFAKRAGSSSVPNYTYNKFGGTIGGPVTLPKIYNGKNRTFFFVDVDIDETSSAQRAFRTVPTLLERAGDFSETRDKKGRLYVIYNPFDTFTAPDGSVRRRPFPGNVIPGSMHDPVAVNLLKYYPEPNSEGQPFTHARNLFAEGTKNAENYQTSVRLDHALSDRQRLYGRYGWNRSGPGKPFRAYGDSPADKALSWLSYTNVASVEYTFTQNPTTVWSARYNLSRQTVDNVTVSDGFDPTTLGLPPIVLTAGVKRFPTVSIQGYSGLGPKPNAGRRRRTTTHSTAYSVTKIIGGHSLKAGGESRSYLINAASPYAPVGRFAFNRRETSQSPFVSKSAQGNAVASMLLGWGRSGTYGINEHPASASQYHGWYVQDNWKVTRRLTLNLGLRYDFELPRTERYDRYTWFDFDMRSPIDEEVPELDLSGGLRFTSREVRSPFDKDLNNIQPRFGFAYAVTGKMTVRGGYGLYYTVSKTLPLTELGPPFAVRTPVLWSLDGGVSRYASLSNPWPDGLIFPSGKSQGAATFLGQKLNTQSRPNRNPQIQQWAFSIQRALPSTSLLEINYTGTKGTYLYFPDLENVNRLHPVYWDLGRPELNKKVPNPFHGVITDPTSPLSRPTVVFHQLLRPYPQYTGLTVSTPTIANSIYHALQVKFEKRMSHGISAIAHYTWAKMIDDASNSGYDFFGGDSAVQNFWNLRLERSLSVTDVRHRAVVSFVWELPFGRGRAFGSNWNRFLDAVAGGWRASGVMTFQSGFPVVIRLARSNLLEGRQRPHLIGDPAVAGSVRDKLDNYFNEAAFAEPEPDTYGSAPRTLGYRNPRIINSDLTVSKEFRFLERHRIELRLEAFNAFNGVVFDKPDARYGSNTFGQISSYARGFGPRQLQFGIRYQF